MAQRHATDLTYDECRRACVWSLAGFLREGTNAFQREACTRAKCTYSGYECKRLFYLSVFDNSLCDKLLIELQIQNNICWSSLKNYEDIALKSK